MQDKREPLVQKVKDSLGKAQEQATQLSKTNTRLMIMGAVNSAISTLVTGVTAAGGPVIGEGIPGWRLACIVGAIFAFAATLSVGLQQQLRINERLSQANQAKARLNFLETAIDTDSRSWDDITREYENIMMSYPDMI